MLRHYDALGLLRPARVDPSTGYRHYSAAQLARLNRIIALKELGFSLQQVGAILDEKVDTEELRGMLRLRRAELAESVAAETARLAQVEARLRTIEEEGLMATDEVVLKTLPAVRVAELTTTAESYEPQHIGPAVGPLFQELCRRLEAAGIRGFGPGIAYYEPATEGGADARPGDSEILVHAAMTVGPEVVTTADFTVVTLPEVEAATIVHRGAMQDLMPTIHTLVSWLDASEYVSTGFARELYLECPPDENEWVTELQEPVRKA
jgi:DNA-binding transcriptional MerR regulator